MAVDLAVAGLAGALGGVVVGGVIEGVREALRAKRERSERWYQVRQTAYVDFLAANLDLLRDKVDNAKSGDKYVLGFELFERTWRAKLVIDLVGSRSVSTAAEDVQKFFLTIKDHEAAPVGPDATTSVLAALSPDFAEGYRAVHTAFVRAARADLRGDD